MSNYLDNKELFMTPNVNQYGSHMVMTNVCKETKTKYLNIDTKFSDDIILNNTNSTSATAYDQSNYNFTLPEKITDVKSIYVDNVQFPNIQSYNISEALGNNCFSISTEPAPLPPDFPYVLNRTKLNYNIIIPDGTYTLKELIYKINSLINLNNELTYNPPDQSKYILNLYCNKIDNDCVYFYMDTSHYFKVTLNFAVNMNGNFDKYNFKSKLGWLLGFRKPTYEMYNIGSLVPDNGITNQLYSIVPTYTQISDIKKGIAYDFSSYKSELIAKTISVFSEVSPIFPLPTKYYYLVIDEFSTNFQNTFISTLPYSLINKYIICKININQSNLKSFANYYISDSVTMINQGLNYGDSMYYSANNTNGYLTSSKRIYNGKIDIQKMNVKVIDENGNMVNMQGYDFSFCLRIEHE
jgi:hypothetical protein